MNKGARILIWSSNFWNFADGLLGPLFAVFAQKIGGNVLDIAWAWGAYLIVVGICIVIVGYASDRVAKLPLLFAGYIFTALLTFGYLFVKTPMELFVLQAAMGFAIALSNPTYMSLLGRFSIDGGNEGTTWGWADGRDKIATGLAVFIGGLVVSTWSFEVLFVIMGTLQLVATACIALLFRAEHIL